MSLDKSSFLYYCLIYIVIVYISYNSPCAANSSMERDKKSIEKFYTRFNNISTHEVDLVFVLDRSASVSYSAWQTIINFVRSLLEHFTVDNRNTRVAVVTYSTETSVDINDLGETFETKCSLMRRIQKSLINKPLKGYTATHDALITTRNILYNSRKNAKKAVFVLTDGKSNIGPPPVRASVELRSLLWDRDWNSELNGPQLEVFALGVHNAEMSELDSIASPLPNHTCHIPDFYTFRQLARSLHQDQQSESWVPVKDQTPCQIPCSKHAICMCGTKSGDAVCICKAGYEGDGHVCTACSKGYYKDGIFPGRCKPCPSHSTTPGVAATDHDQCHCVQRYYRRSPREPCQLQTCLDLPEIQYGVKFHVTGRVFDEQLTGDSGCLNTPDSSCHYRCERGYRLTGHPALVCEANGTWTGNVPQCQIIDCGTIDTHGQSVKHGKVVYYNNSTTFGSTVRVKCDHGWRLLGDTVRTCTHHGIWSDTQAWCVEIRCSRLPSVVKGQVTPSACVETTQRLGQDCNVTCNSGYHLQGAQQLTCTDKGDWSHDPNVTCVDIEPPKIICPNDMVVPITEGNFTIVHWKENAPRVEDNSGYFIVKIVTLIRSPAKLTTGYHQIEFEAEDSAGNTNGCTMAIQVVEKTVHNTFCPDNILFTDVIGLEKEVSWPSPVFIDNENRTLDYKCSREAGSLFPIGKHNVYCTSVRQPRASICSFSIELLRKTCDIPPAPKNGALVCQSLSETWLQQCSVMCNDNYDFYNFPQTFYKCGLDGRWILRDGVLWPDCSAIHFSGNAFMEGDYEYFYYHGDCEDIKTQIVEKFYSLVQMHSWDECGEHVCTIGEVMVTCGKNRRRRTVNSFIDTARQKRDIPKGFTSKSDSRTAFTFTSEIHQTTSVTTVMDGTSTNSVFPEIPKRGRKHVSVHFGVNVTSLTATKPRFLTRTLLRLQRRLRWEIQNNDIDFSIVSDKCSGGYVMKKRSHSIGVCVACPVGRYHQRHRNTCLPCPVGTYQDREGKLICIPCPKEKSTRTSGSSNSSDCRAKCEEGHYSATGLEPCFQCDEGTYQENVGQTACKKCPGNTTTATSGARNKYDCKDACNAGTYNNLTGFTPCVPCPQGTFQPRSGMTSCIMCPDNMTTSNSGSQNVEDCKKIDFCSIVTSKLCGKRGTCVNMVDGYTCHCNQGYTGTSCEVNVDDCSSQPCAYNATCFDGVDDFVCVCPPNRRGRHCEITISPCESMPCFNGGSCVETEPGEYQCFCPYMYQGSLCEKHNACASQPCYNGDCQIQDLDNYTCTCHRGYVGRNCEVVDLCQLKPCLNEGKCTLKPNGFQCSCTSGHTGHFCETALLDPCSDDPCGKNGNCYTYNGEVKCKCYPGYGGKACRESVSPDFDLVFGRSSTTDYVLLRPVFDPALVSAKINSLTICLWMRSPDKANYGTPFSYSAYSNSLHWEESNMLTLTDYGQLKLLIHGNEALTDIEVNDGNWHHICVMWKSAGGLWNIYINGSIATSGNNLSSNVSITSNGYFVVGQEQDVVGGAFSSRESFVGEISQLNFFDRVLSEKDVIALASQKDCNKTYGNIIAWTDVTGGIRGKVQIRRDSHCLDVNECLYPGSYNCSEQRECRDIIGGYQCAACLYGYQGDDCNQPINECDMNVCYNQAVCIDGPLPYDFICKCSHGFTGSFCEVAIDFCASSPCQNNGTCFGIDKGYRCVCLEDNSGINCEHEATKIPASCQTSSCQNNGTCTSILDTRESICVCSPGFKGFFCEMEVNACEQQPCQNGAECVDKEAGGYHCFCGPFWKGRNCEIRFILDCSQSPCLSNGTCINEPNSAQGYRCQCPVSTGTSWGPNCERNFCESNPCFHNGICVNLDDNNYKCLCQSPYTGDRCNIDVHGQLSTKSVTHSSSAIEPSTDDGNRLSTSDPKEATSVFPKSKHNSFCDKLYCEHGGTCQQISEDRAWCICLIDFTGQDCSIYRKRVTSKFDVSLVIKKQYNYFYEEGWLFKSEFSKQVRALYHGMLQDDKIQVRNVHFRPGKDHEEMVASFQLIYTKYLDTNTPALTSREINQVMQDTVKSGYLGNLSVSKFNLSFQAVTNELKDEQKGSVSSESTLSYMIGGVVILTVSLGTIITVLCVKMKKFRYSYRKTSRLLHHLNNSNDMGLNLITNPVFDGISDRIQPHGEETSCSNMYAELGDMLDPYCVTSKADLREEGLLRRQSSVYSSKRSNKECNIERERFRKNSEFSDTLSDSSKKTNTSLDTSFTESEHHHCLNKNEFTQQIKKDTKELLPSFGKHGKIDNTDIMLGAKCETWYENSDVSLSPDIDHSAGSHTFSVNPFRFPDESDKLSETPPPSYATVIEEEEANVSFESERPKCDTPKICVLQSNNENNFLYDIPNTYIIQGSYSSVPNTNDVTISPAVDSANLIYSSPLPEDDDADKVVYFSPLPSAKATKGPDKKFSFSNVDITCYSKEKVTDCTQKQENPLNDSTRGCSTLKKKESVSIIRKDSASQTDYVDMDNGLLLDKVVHWRRKKQHNPPETTPPLSPEMSATDTLDENSQKEDEGDYVEPNHPFMKSKQSGTKVRRKDSASQTDYIDMDKKPIRKLRRGSESTLRDKDLEPCRRKSMDDYLEVLPDKLSEEKPSCSTLPRTLRKKDMSRRKLPPLPHDSSF